MRIVRSRAHELGLSKPRIGFTGFSAGGHLTAHISTVRSRFCLSIIRFDILPVHGAHLV